MLERIGGGQCVQGCNQSAPGQWVGTSKTALINHLHSRWIQPGYSNSFSQMCLQDIAKEHSLYLFCFYYIHSFFMTSASASSDFRALYKCCIIIISIITMAAVSDVHLYWH